MTQVWMKIDRSLSDYPVGTKARESWSGFRWTKTYLGWKADGGDTFPRPGSANEVLINVDERGWE